MPTPVTARRQKPVEAAASDLIRYGAACEAARRLVGATRKKYPRQIAAIGFDAGGELNEMAWALRAVVEAVADQLADRPLGRRLLDREAERLWKALPPLQAGPFERPVAIYAPLAAVLRRVQDMKVRGRHPLSRLVIDSLAALAESESCPGEEYLYRSSMGDWPGSC